VLRKAPAVSTSSGASASGKKEGKSCYAWHLRCLRPCERLLLSRRQGGTERAGGTGVGGTEGWERRHRTMDEPSMLRNACRVGTISSLSFVIVLSTFTFQRH